MGGVKKKHMQAPSKRETLTMKVEKMNILVTGATRGVGLALINALTPEKSAIFALGRNFDSFSAELAEKIECVEYDLADIEGIPALINSLPAIDILVNNAGMMLTKPHDEYTRVEVSEILAVNLEAPVALMREVSKNMMVKKSGRIINIASIAGHNGLYFDIWYGISKAGLINATKTYAKLLGEHGIAVNAIAPGPIETDMLNSIPIARQEGFKNAVPSHRCAKPEEVAEIARWLAEESPAYMTGACLDVNNGYLMR
jgi:3-oxoacyl-[acyl-carrier protein] reductase